MGFPLTQLSGGDKLKNNIFEISKLIFRETKKDYCDENDDFESIIKKVDAFWNGELNTKKMITRSHHVKDH